jgi:L-alanine-DL-glutamate epimerase-like enolase superfamily enzyme
MALGTAAAVHAGIGIPNLAPVEYFPFFETARDDVCSGRLSVKGGKIVAPDLPGLGVTFDDGAMIRFRA